MLVETLGLSLIIGKLRKGKIRNLGKLHIRGWYLFIIGFILEVISLTIVANTKGRVSRFIIDYFAIIHTFVFLMVIIGLVLNIRERWIWLTLIGTIMNFIPVLANDGRMPVSTKGLINSHLYEQINLLKDNKILTHIIVDENTRFYYLSDIIPIPKPYPLPKVISFGDILIGISIFLLIQYYMKVNFKGNDSINFIDYRYFKV